MRRASMWFALMLAGFMLPAFAGVPALNSDAICKRRAADAKLLRSTAGQSVADCVHGEEAAKQQLSAVWEKSSARTRNQCESEARALGTTSYLDLLTCLQMAEEMKSDSQKKGGKK